VGVIKRLIVVLLALGLVLGAIFGWKFHMLKPFVAGMSRPPPPETVASATMELQDWQPYLSSVGSLVATQGVYVSNEIAGMVRDIKFESGQPVKRGVVGPGNSRFTGRFVAGCSTIDRGAWVA
jgi:membrane fusion protein (multidrug efflux system)